MTAPLSYVERMIAAVFAEMPDAPPELRGDLSEAIEGREWARMASEEQRLRRNAAKRRRRRESGHPCATCDAIVTRDATHCRSCWQRVRGRKQA